MRGASLGRPLACLLPAGLFACAGLAQAGLGGEAVSASRPVATVSVTAHGAVPNDGKEDTRAAVVYVTASRNVRIVGNRLPVEGRAERMKAPVVIGPNCEEKTIVVEQNEGL